MPAAAPAAVRVPPQPEVDTIIPLQDLVETLRFLRSENGCPWDRQQTLADMCRYLIDEAYELQDAVRDERSAESVEELGDVLFLVLCCGLILEERGASDLEQVARAARDKIVRRHPHVFADRSAASPEEGLRHWRDMKESELRERGESPPLLLEKIPRSLPPLRRALTVQRKVAGVGFEWETSEQVYAKFLEEARELKEVLGGQDAGRVEDELGDMLFSVVNLGRFLGVDAETALQSTVTKFAKRFAYVERNLREHGRSLEDASLEEMDALWEESKTKDLPGPAS
ncbi:MAG: nucleoside triphosphate pyrophosphohydrolase [Candidatus Krumholzibacteriia bacterium]